MPVTLALSFLLTACAHDNYTVDAGGTGSQDRLAADLHDCKMYAIHAHAQSFGREFAAGIVSGGLAAGQEAASDPNYVGIADINPMIEACMKAKGYTGTSEN